MGDLDFDMLDDLAFAFADGAANPAAIPTLSVDRIGPYLEWRLLRSGWPSGRADNVRAIGSQRLASFLKALASSRIAWTEPQYRNTGFLRISQRDGPRENAWVAFGLEMQKAALKMGFPGPTAAQLVAALGEFHSNIIEHSEAAASGTLAFSAVHKRMEFVAFDAGVGVLKSLQRSSVYRALSDHGDALELALTDGVSRFGRDSGRGLGFRELFVGLANLNASLRFRTGDYALTIDGQSPTLVSATTTQKAPIPGFLISVDCVAP